MEKTSVNIFDWKKIFKGVCGGVCLSIIGVFIFATLYKFLNISDMLVRVINQIIKIFSIMFACFICLRKDKSKGLIKGLIVSLLYTLLSFLIFSLLAQNFSISIGFLYDLIFSLAIGLMSGVIFVNIKR